MKGGVGWRVKVLLVTGQLAKGLVERYSQETPVEVDVLALPTAVAALMNPRYIIRHLKGRVEGVGYQLILLPGLVQGDVGLVEEAVGVPVFKGPRYAADLPPVLEFLSKMPLSRTSPADEFLEEELRRRGFELIRETEEREEALLRGAGNLRIGGLTLGGDFPPRIMAEIVDAPLMTDGELQRRALYYAESGADIIDVGMRAGESKPEEAFRCVRAVKRAVKRVVSIDTLDVEEMRAGVEAGAELVLSIDGGNMEGASQVLGEAAAVVLPTDFQRKIFPRRASERVLALEENLRRARELGIKLLLADPILDPIVSPGLTESIAAYHQFRGRNPDAPLFMGVGNVAELLDADTPGVSAVLMGIAAELDVGVVLTTEVSDKNRGHVRELAAASRMMFIAKKKGCIPKRLGVDLLVMRDRWLREEPFNPELRERVRVVEARGGGGYRPDPKGCFKVLVDREEGKILVLHYPEYRLDQPSVIIEGERAVEVYSEALREGLLSTLEHAAYLGCELQKAEVALKLGKSYIQDAPLY